MLRRVVVDPSAILVGRYRLHGEIASGGMARVHLGRFVGPVGFTRTVAIKRMHPHLLVEESLGMFVDEARLAARVRHPNVVPIVEIVAEQRELFLVMEYVHGESLAHLMRLASPSPAVAVAIMLNVLDGLHAAHEARDGAGALLEIVHRDVSPHNVLVGVDGTARVADFGIAKAASRLVTTGDGGARGKLPYMAPEQLTSSAIDRRADVWSAAVVLWELLAKRRLFTATHEGALVFGVLEGPIPAPSSIAPELQPFDDVVLRGLVRPLDGRFPTARAFAEALEKAYAPATPREVGAWVASVASASLAERAAQIAAMEALDPVALPDLRTEVAAFAAGRRTEPAPPTREPASEALELQTQMHGGRSVSAAPQSLTASAAIGAPEIVPPPRPVRPQRRVVVVAAVGSILAVCSIGVVLASIPGAPSGERGQPDPTPTVTPSSPVSVAAPSREEPPAPVSAAAVAGIVPPAPTAAHPVPRAGAHPRAHSTTTASPHGRPAPQPAPIDSVRMDRRK